MSTSDDVVSRQQGWTGRIDKNKATNLCLLVRSDTGAGSGEVADATGLLQVDLSV